MRKRPYSYYSFCLFFCVGIEAERNLNRVMILPYTLPRSS